MKIPEFIFSTFDLNLGKFSFAVPYVQVIVLVVLLFMLVISMAHLRRHYVDGSFKGVAYGIFFGFILAIILEGFLLVYGKTALIGILGWKDAPKPVSIVLEAGREKLSNVLGAETNTNDQKDLIKQIQSLNPAESKKLKGIICAQ